MDRPAWPWRLLAWIQFVLCGLITIFELRVSPISSLGIVIPTWITIGGLLAYAYGLPARPLWFWRAFAILISLYLMWDIGDDLARLLASPESGPARSSARIVIFLISVPLNVFTCIGHLRYSKLLREERRSAIQDLEDVFA